MENRSCQDNLRHDSPFRQGVSQSSTALWDCWTHATMALALQPEEPSVPFSVVAFLPSLSDDLLNVKDQLLSVFVPFLFPAGSALINLSFPSCVILPAALSLSRSTWSTLGPLCVGQPLSWPLLTVCSRRRVIGPGVGLWHPPGILLPSHCPPSQQTEHV